MNDVEFILKHTLTFAIFFSVVSLFTKIYISLLFIYFFLLLFWCFPFYLRICLCFLLVYLQRFSNESLGRNTDLVWQMLSGNIEFSIDQKKKLFFLLLLNPSMNDGSVFFLCMKKSAFEWFFFVISVLYKRICSLNCVPMSKFSWFWKIQRTHTHTTHAYSTHISRFPSINK